MGCKLITKVQQIDLNEKYGEELCMWLQVECGIELIDQTFKEVQTKVEK